MTADNPQVCWTDEQWARVNQVIQEEASRARVAASFLPLYGPLPADTDFVRREEISYREPESPPITPEKQDLLVAAEEERRKKAIDAFNAAIKNEEYETAAEQRERIASADAVLQRQRIRIDDRNTIKLATLQVKVPVRTAQMADPEMQSVLALFRRAANVLARLEDAVVFRGLSEAGPPRTGVEPTGGAHGLPDIWEIRGGQELRGLLDPHNHEITFRATGERLVRTVSNAIGHLESHGHFGPFAVVLDQGLFSVAQNPTEVLVLPQDRILPFLGGGPLLRSTTLPRGNGVVVALGGAPVELVIAKDVSLQFLQVTNEPRFLFRVREKMALRIKEPDSIVQLQGRRPVVGP
jgi:uncharacterized linocin/CFP29 family protein